MSDDWMLQAACRGMDPDLFFPERGESLAKLRRICGSCVVREACLDYAIAKHEKDGVWGGMSGRERRREARRRRREAAGRLGGPDCGTEAGYRAGCRCILCVMAKARAARQRRVLAS